MWVKNVYLRMCHDRSMNQGENIFLHIKKTYDVQENKISSKKLSMCTMYK